VLTVPEAARQLRRNPETIRRWIRSGRLPSHKVGTQHLIEEDDLAEVAEVRTLPLPPGWDRTGDGKPMPDFVAIIRAHRMAH
jgi:excisionase family DNA binding protein